MGVPVTWQRETNMAWHIPRECADAKNCLTYQYEASLDV